MNGVQRAGVFSTCGMGVGSCAFLKRVGEIFGSSGVSSSLGFDLQARLCRLAARQLSPTSPFRCYSCTAHLQFSFS